MQPKAEPCPPGVGAAAPRSENIFLHGADSASVRQVAASLGGVYTLSTGSFLAPPRPLTDFQLVIADYDALPQEERSAAQQLSTRAGPRLLLLSGGDAETDFATLFADRTLTNLLACNGTVSPDDLRVTVDKVLRGDLFGLERYFPPDVHPERRGFHGSREKAELVMAAEQFAFGAGARSRIASLFGTIADELVTNCLYNAPTRPDGTHRFAHWARTREVQLESAERCELAFACDGKRLGISATDPFGSLTRDRLLDYLSRCFRAGKDQIDSKPGGAGLGLYLMLRSCDHLVVNIAPGARTEIIALIDLNGSFRQLAARQKSFNLFIAD